MKDWTKIIAYLIGTILIGVGISMAFLMPGGADHPATIGVFITAGVGLFTGWNRNGVLLRNKTLLKELSMIKKRITLLEKKSKKS